MRERTPAGATGGLGSRGDAAWDDEALEQGEDAVENEREGDDDDRGAEDLGEVPQRDALDDVVAEAAEADVRGDRHGGDDLQGRGPEPADEQRQPQRHLDLPEDLPRGHAHRAPGIDDAAVDRLEAGVRAGEDRGDREQDEGHDGRLGLQRDAEEQHEQHDESERGQGTGGA